MKELSLNGLWNARCITNNLSFSFAANVPGCSIKDLIDNEYLPKNIFYKDNAKEVGKFETANFEYSKTFLYQKKDELIYLYFDNIDTYCDIYLNNYKIDTTSNGFISYEYDISDKILDGENTLKLFFYSPIEKTHGLPKLTGAFTTERLYTRRIQCNYGWDWVERFISCGISGNVSIKSYAKDEIIIEDLYIYTKSFDNNSASMELVINPSKSLGKGNVIVKIFDYMLNCTNLFEVYLDGNKKNTTFDILNPSLWYPVGYGNQHLYTLEIVDKTGNILKKEIFGIRTIEIEELKDELGTLNYQKCLEIKNSFYDKNQEFSSFKVKINGKPILCMGANWVPAFPFYLENPDKKVTELLELAVEMGLNIIRIWGGGRFETKHFYSECSRLGIMIVHDFMMACGTYPEKEEWFIKELNKEASYGAKLVRNYPSLLWWHGDNENAVEGNDELEYYTGKYSAFKGIKPILDELDYTHRFLPSSPYGGNMYASNTVGTTHNTQFLGSNIFPYILNTNCCDYKEKYQKIRARFISEEPQFGAICESSILNFMDYEDVFGNSLDMWNYHTKSNPALQTSLFDTFLIFTKKILGDFKNSDDRYFKMRYLQYELIRVSLEQLRREMWYESGLIYWMLNDCWPAASGWALIDYYNHPKDGFYAFKRCAKKVVLSFSNEKNNVKLFASNIDSVKKKIKIDLYKITSTTTSKFDSIIIDVDPNSSKEIYNLEIVLDDSLIIADSKEDRTFYKNGNLEIKPVEINYTVDKENGKIKVSSDQYVHAVELDGNMIFEDNCFSLLPDEEKTIGCRKGDINSLKVQAYSVIFKH